MSYFINYGHNSFAVGLNPQLSALASQYPGINNVIAHRELLMVMASLAYCAIILCCLYQYDSEKGYLDAPKVDSSNCNWTVMRELSQVSIYLNTTHCAKLDHLMVQPVHSPIVWTEGDICIELHPCYRSYPNPSHQPGSSSVRPALTCHIEDTMS